ncbi:MAG: carboxypeptidase regulatory-like domain-containing protein [Planctomycetaceae bacterium]
MTFSQSMSALSLSFVLCVLPGCSGGHAPELGLVTGTVTLDGKPLSGVEVGFHPTDGRPAFGRTDLAGQYHLTYMPQKPGCKIGSNVVTIGNAEGEEDVLEMEGDNAVSPTAKAKPRIPERYNVKSELKAEVQPGQNEFDFDLKSKS